jgi:hypothetical protein
MKANNILNRILAELSSIREVKFEQMTLENGAVLEAEVFEAGNEVFIVSGEDRVAAPVGEHLLSDGRVLVITEEGVIAEIKEAEAEVEVEVEVPEAEVELAEVEVKEEVPAADVAEAIAKVIEEVTAMREEMKAMREEMGGYAKKEEMAALRPNFLLNLLPSLSNTTPKQSKPTRLNSNALQRQLTESLHVLTTNKNRKWQRPLQSPQTMQVNLRASTSLLLF